MNHGMWMYLVASKNGVSKCIKPLKLRESQYFGGQRF